MLPSNHRVLNGLQALSGMLLILIAVFYFQHHLQLEPCYLCITQRVFVIAITLVCTLAALHNPSTYGQRAYASLSTMLAVVGGYFSIKQLWLQSLPDDKVPACGIPVDYLFDVFSLSEAISHLLKGDGNCAEVQWQLLGISMPGWVLVAFIGYAAIGIIQITRKA
ncbi:MAG: disulfide bond formation protein B [Porticoccaceae bacterium]|nr:disulfide bond formation protein B [Porticoccaceae bacterium]